MSLTGDDTSNGRSNLCLRAVNDSGTGTIISAQGGGYSRDTSEDQLTARSWAVIDSPGASSTWEIQGITGTDDPGTGDEFVNGSVEFIPIYYSAIGLYTSGTTQTFTGTSFTRATGWSASVQSDTTAIELGATTSNVIDCKNNGKRYLVLGGAYFNCSVGRTQRVANIRRDSVNSAQGVMYLRSSSVGEMGTPMYDLFEGGASAIGVDMAICRGIGVAARQGGADIDGSVTTADTELVLAIIELNDSAEVIRSHSTSQQECALTGPVDINAHDVVDLNDSASYTKASATAVNVETAHDALVLANNNCPRNAGAIGSGSRWTAFGHITLNGTELASSEDCDYNRGNQSTTDTHGWSTHPATVVTVAVNDDLGVSITERVGTEGGAGDIETEPFANNEGMSFIAINLDTLADSGVSASGGATMGAVEASGTATNHIEASDGTPSLAAVTAAGTAKVVKRTTAAAATLAALTAAGTADVQTGPDVTASGGGTLAAIEASGGASLAQQASDGTPTLTALEAAGTSKRVIVASLEDDADEATDFTDYENGPGGYANLAIASGKYQDDTGLSTNAARRNDRTFADDQWAEIEIDTALDTDNAYFQVFTRFQAAAAGAYIGVIQPQDDGTCDLWIEEYDGSSWTNISGTVSITHDLADGDTLRIEVQGDRQRLYFNGTLYCLSTDASHASGTPGLGINRNNATTATDNQVERWTFGNLVNVPGLEIAGTAKVIKNASDGTPSLGAVESSGTASKYDKPETSVRVSFPTPTYPPKVGADEQKFKAYVRKDASGGTDPTLRAYLYESGVQRQDLGTVTVTSETGVLVSWTWNATNLTVADGSDVEVLIEVDTMGTGSNRRTVEYGAIEWCCVWSSAATGAATLTALTASGTAKTVKAASDGTPTLAALEASGTTTLRRQASDGTPTVPLPVGDGEASSNISASGAATLPALESSGTATVVRQASDGTPALSPVSAAGTATNHRTATDGTPTLAPVEAAGTADITGVITASDGAPEVPALTAAGTTTLTRQASGTPSIPAIEAAGTADTGGFRTASGNADLTLPVGAGTASLIRSSSGSATIPAVEASGTATRRIQARTSGRRNEIEWSNDVSNVAWIESGLASRTANRIVEDTSTGTHLIQTSGYFTDGVGVVTTISFEAKADGRDSILVRTAAAGYPNNVGKYFNVSLGTLGNNYSLAPDAAYITPVAGDPGWYLCEMVLTADQYNGNTRAIIGMADGNVSSYTGDGTSAIEIRKVQVEQWADRRTDYIETTDASLLVEAPEIPGVEASGQATKQIEASDGAPETPVLVASGDAKAYTRFDASGTATIPVLVASGTSKVVKKASGTVSVPSVGANGVSTRRIYAGLNWFDPPETFLDDFNRADGPIGNSWDDWIPAGYAIPDIVSGQLPLPVSLAFVGAHRENGHGPAQFAEIEVNNWTYVSNNSDTAPWVLVRGSADMSLNNESGYFGYLYSDTDGSTVAELYRWDPNYSYTSFGKTVVLPHSNVPDGTIIRMVANGNRIEQWINWGGVSDGWTFIHAVIDSTYPTQTRVGFGNDSYVIGATLDNFRSGDLGPGPQMTVPVGDGSIKRYISADGRGRCNRALEFDVEGRDQGGTWSHWSNAVDDLTPVTGFNHGIKIDNVGGTINSYAYGPGGGPNGGFLGAIPAGMKIRMSAYVEMLDGSEPMWKGVDPNPVDAGFTMNSSWSGTDDALQTQKENVWGNVWRISTFRESNGGSNYGVLKYSWNSTRAFRITGWQIEEVADKFQPASDPIITTGEHLCVIDVPQIQATGHVTRGEDGTISRVVPLTGIFDFRVVGLVGLFPGPAVFQDDFNRLGPALGVPWEHVGMEVPDGYILPQIDTGGAFVPGNPISDPTNGVNGYAIGAYNQELSDDHSVILTIGTIDEAASPIVWPWTRAAWDGSGENQRGYYCYTYPWSGTVYFDVYRWESPRTYTYIGGGDLPAAFGNLAGSQIRFESIGDQHAAYWRASTSDPWTQVGTTVTDATHSDGKTGFGVEQFTTDNDVRIREFYAVEAPRFGLDLEGEFTDAPVDGVFDPDSDLEGTFDPDRVVPGKGDPVD